MNWLSENIGTIALTLAIAAVVGLVVFKMIKDKKKGKSGCGCGCSGCALSDQCRNKK